MNRKDFQKYVDETVNPDFFFEQRLKEKVMSADFIPQKKHNKKKMVISALSGVMCLVLALGIFGVSYRSNRILPGSVMIAGANRLESNVDLLYRYGIAVVDERGKTEKEAGDEMVKKRDVLDKAINDDTIQHKLGHRVGGSENIWFYSVQGDAFDINVDHPEDIKEIRLSNENPMLMLQYEFLDGSTDEAEERFYSLTDENYTEVDTEDDWYLLGKNGERITWEEFLKFWLEGLHVGHQLTIDGERYANAKRVQKEERLSNTCDIGLYAADEFISNGICEEMEKNPDFALTDITDTVTFDVAFKNGDIARSVVKVKFNDDGFMIVTLDSYDYIKA